MKGSAVPDINLPSHKIDPAKEKKAVDRAERAAARGNASILDATTAMDTIASVDEAHSIVLKDAAVQVNTSDWDHLFVSRRRSIVFQFKNDSELSSWTGLSSLKMLNSITAAIQKLPEYSKRVHSNVSLDDEVLILFMKMKTNLTFTCMATLFRLHYQTLSTSFYRILPFVRVICEPLVPWPTQQQILSNMPHYFRPDYEDVVSVLDCTEIAIKKPKCLHCRINAYSHYKGKETAKYLISVTPGGTISYVSAGYGGKCSDKQIVVHEKILEKFKIGEAVMTDKGFHIDQECKNYGVKLVRPPFLRSKLPQLSHTDATENMSIAAARVHVERAIQRIKLFDIFNGRIDTRLLPVLDNLVFIACAITNVTKPILANERF